MAGWIVRYGFACEPSSFGLALAALTYRVAASARTAASASAHAMKILPKLPSSLMIFPPSGASAGDVVAPATRSARPSCDRRPIVTMGVPSPAVVRRVRGGGAQAGRRRRARARASAARGASAGAPAELPQLAIHIAVGGLHDNDPACDHTARTPRPR